MGSRPSAGGCWNEPVPVRASGGREGGYNWKNSIGSLLETPDERRERGDPFLFYSILL